MTPAYTLALAASLWTHPGSSPCATPAGNPCWTGPIPTAAGEICDGDLIANTGARDGRMIGPWTQIVALDVEHLIANGYRFRRDGGRVCIPTLTDGTAHLVEACGNWATIIERDSITAAVAYPTRYMRGGPPSAAPRTWGGASSHVASPPIPGVVVWPYEPRTPTVEPHQPSPPPPPIVSLPASLWMLLGALAALALAGMRRRA